MVTVFRSHVMFCMYCTENVAVSKMASQSGSHFSFSTAEKAVDGNTNTEMNEGNCAHPDTRELYGAESNEPAWWRVDLGASYDVYQVEVVNRNSNQCKFSCPPTSFAFF